MGSRSIDIYGGQAPIDVPRYTLLEAAHHLRLSEGAVRSWIRGRSYPSATGKRRSGPVVTPADARGMLLSFGNLAELHVLSAIRKAHGIKLASIRNAVSFLKRHFKSAHPLIESDFLTDGKDLFVEKLAGVVNVSQQGQMVFEWLRLYLDRIERDDQGRPIRLYPFTATIEQPTKLVVIDPCVNFGKPCISGTDIPTDILAERFEAGDTLDELSDDYGRPRPEIEEALRYEQRSRAA